MKNWKENRALACVVLAAAILGGTFGIGGAKLSSAARSVNEAYAQNIAGDLALRAHYICINKCSNYKNFT